MVQIGASKAKQSAFASSSRSLRAVLPVAMLFCLLAVWTNIYPKKVPKSDSFVQKTNAHNNSRTHEAFCSCDDRIVIQMAAVPHTASTTTTKFFANSQRLAWNTSLPLSQRGFVGKDGKTCFYKSSSQQCKEQLDCLFGKLYFKGKVHESYPTLKEQLGNQSVVFTTLRDPAQMIVSQHNMRRTWDALWDKVYTDVSVREVPILDWATRAWWRHNLGTKALATKTAVIWVDRSQVVRGNPPDIVPTHEESDKEGGLEAESTWLKSSIGHLEAMPAFALMHRLQESFELYSFSFCIPGLVVWRPGKKNYAVGDELQAVVQEHFRLDSLLLKEAELIFERKVARMRRLKQEGWVCDLGPMLNLPDDVSVGISCDES